MSSNIQFHMKPLSRAGIENILQTLIVKEQGDRSMKIFHHFVWRKILLCLIVVALGACAPVFELHVNVERQPLPVLGKIAYIQGSDVWVKDLDKEQTTRLTSDGYNTYPKWSADGNWIAYTKQIQLYVLSLDTKHETLLSLASVDWFDWSPSGNTLAFSLWNKGLFVWHEGLEVAKLLLPYPADNSLASFTWGGKDSIRFTRGFYRGGKYHVSIEEINALDGTIDVLFNTTELRQLPWLANNPFDTQMIPFWLWDTQISFPDQEGLPLCMLNASNSQFRCTQTRSQPSNDFLAFSTTNKIAFFSSNTVENHFRNSLVTADVEELQEQQLIKFSDTQYPIEPSWSPDGSEIVFSANPEDSNATSILGRSDNPNCNRRIWVFNIRDSRIRQLTVDEEFCDSLPQWSPDGRKILFARLGNQSASLWLINSDGKNLHEIIPELTPKPISLGSYGFINWTELWDWWTPLPSN